VEDYVAACHCFFNRRGIAQVAGCGIGVQAFEVLQIAGCANQQAQIGSLFGENAG
jgi:hypothetical protein